MEIVYYYESAQKYCPVKNYLNSLLRQTNKKVIADIDVKIRRVAENECRPIPPLAYPLIGFSFFEIKRRKDKNILIRICFFRYEDNMVLLHAFEKPDNYSSSRIKRLVEREYEIAKKYMEKFIKNPKLYEEYK